MNESRRFILGVVFAAGGFAAAITYAVSEQISTRRELRSLEQMRIATMQDFERRIATLETLAGLTDGGRIWRRTGQTVTLDEQDRQEWTRAMRLFDDEYAETREP